MFCKVCGTELRNNAKFCDNCGTQVDEQVISGSYNCVTLEDRYDEEWKNAKKIIRQRKIKRFIKLAFVAFIFGVWAYIDWKIAPTSWSGIGMVFFPLACVFHAMYALAALIHNTTADNVILSQINQAYQNEKMRR